MTEPADPQTSVTPTPATPPELPPREPAPEPPVLSRGAVVRLVICAVLFGGWIAYLTLLVGTRSEPPAGPRLLSRPQALNSTLDVIATVDPAQMRPEVKIVEVLYPESRKDLVGQTILVPNLPECGVLRRDGTVVRDATEAGEYLLLLNEPAPDKPGMYTVAPIPPSPGFGRDERTGVFGQQRPRAYRATSDIRAQYRQVVKPKVKASGAP